MPGLDVRDDPERVADAIVAAHRDEGRWLDVFAQALDRRRAGSELAYVLGAWDLSQAEAGRLFGVSRQAVGKWLARGVPRGRVEAVADLAAATDLLVHYLRRERIPAVVRRGSAALDGASLHDLAAAGATRQVLAACRDMFDFADAHG